MLAAGNAYGLPINSHLIAYLEPCPAHIKNADLYLYDIRKCGAFFVITFHPEDRRCDPFFLHLIVPPAHLFHKIQPGFFHKADVVGMVGELHLVCFIIIDFMSVRSHLFLLEMI